MNNRRLGVTAIELVAVLAVAAILGTMSAASLLPFLRKGKVAEAASLIDRANHDARARARREHDASTARYGVRLDGSNPVAAVEVVREEGGSRETLSRATFNANLVVYTGENALNGEFTWWFQPRTGYPLAAPGDATVSAIGAVPPGQPEHLSVRTVDGRLRQALAVYEIGIVSTEAF